MCVLRVIIRKKNGNVFLFSLSKKDIINSHSLVKKTFEKLYKN
jgi:hypothetical protein